VSAGERALWDYLDHCGYAFRRPGSELITEYGSRNCGWTDGLDYCELESAKPFIEGLAHPVTFQFAPGSYQGAPPGTLQGYVRLSSDPFENYKTAVDQLQALFGPGEDASVSNTKSRRWRFGSAQVSATIFPAELNQPFGSNSRHDRIPGSQTECSIYIETAYCPPLSAREAEAVATYSQIHAAPSPRHTMMPLYISDTIRARGEMMPGAAEGFGLSGGETYLIRVDSKDHIHVLPAEWIHQVMYTKLLPAKGGGGLYLDVRYWHAGLKENGSSHLTLVQSAFKEGAYLGLARRLAKTLGVPLEEYEDYDV